MKLSSMRSKSQYSSTGQAAKRQSSINSSFRRKIGSLAEENQVRNFNKPRTSETIPPSQPQRIQLPLFFNTPCRIKSSTMQNKLNKTATEDPNKMPDVDTGVYVSTMRRLKDYEMLALACRRGGKIRDEGRSYYSIGVLYDNVQKYQKAIEYYDKFLQVCKSIGDSHGEALAYNCIGVNYQMLSQKDISNMAKAIEYHNKHEQLADTNGKFLASINLGLCYDRLGDTKNSVYWYQSALKHSIKMSNLVGQSLAIGNIGKIGAKGLNDNKDKMKVFVEKYLKLAKEMKDEKGQMNGCLKLGLISGSKKNFQEGRQNFLRALELAENSGQTEIYNEAKCGIAVVTAQRQMNSYLRRFTNQLDNQSFNLQ